jgi:DUF1009 family protein
LAKKKKDADEALAEIYDKIWDQFAEDRSSIKDVYDDIKSLTSGNVERLVVLGDSLTKCAELMTKQTSQIIELLKIAEKKKERDDDDTLSKEDIDAIYKQVGDKHQ